MNSLNFNNFQMLKLSYTLLAMNGLTLMSKTTIKDRNDPLKLQTIALSKHSVMFDVLILTMMDDFVF